MKNLFLITIFLTSAIWSHAQWPSLNLYSAAGQVQIRANINYAVNRAADSTGKAVRADFATFRKGTLDSLDKLNTYITSLQNDNKKLLDSLRIVAKSASAMPAQDTTWKKAIRDLQTAVNELKALPTITAADLKVYADKVEAIRLALINWTGSLKL